ncbi:MCE family protein [Acetobacteraceae bacterium]|nr:MCE family protein [Acetobacteraceae bacterium]
MTEFPDPNSSNENPRPHHSRRAYESGEQISERFQEDEDEDAILRPTRVSVLWVIPVIAIGISLWMAWHYFSSQGPEITISFESGDGLNPGQTQVKDLAVPMGTVKEVKLADDLTHVQVLVKMSRNATHFLTDKTRFWIVRPQVSGGTISGLETIMSGSYIAMDPGPPNAKHAEAKTSFVGLETPPGRRWDQPGTNFWVMTPSLGALGGSPSGAPVFYRDLNVGEVLGYTTPNDGIGPMMVQIFVRKPYDRYLRVGSRCWNASGVEVGFSGGAFKLQLESLQALLSGGIAFGPPVMEDSLTGNGGAPAEPDSVFWLYNSESDAKSTRYKERIKVVTYVDSSVGSLAKGSVVSMFGVQIGVVSNVALDLCADTCKNKARVRIEMMLEPGRVAKVGVLNQSDIEKHKAHLLDFLRDGLRASVTSGSMLTGETVIALSFGPKPKDPKLVYENDGAIVIPGDPGGVNAIIDNVSKISDKISKMPLEQIANNLNGLLGGTSKIVNNPDTEQTIKALRDSLRSLSKLLSTTDKNLPALTAQANKTMASASTFLDALSGDSDLHHNVQNMVVQMNEMVTTLRQLLSYLSYHPNAVIVGRH